MRRCRRKHWHWHLSLVASLVAQTKMPRHGVVHIFVQAQKEAQHRYWSSAWIPAPSEGHPYKNLLVSCGSPNPSPGYIFVYGLSMAGSYSRSGSAGRFPPLACSGRLGALGRLCPHGPPVTLAPAPRRTYSWEHLLTLSQGCS